MATPIPLQVPPRQQNLIQVSNMKKPLFFYVNLAKRNLQQHGVIELSGLGMAVATVVTVAEILKNSELAVVTKIATSTVESRGDGGEDGGEARGSTSKAKIEIHLTKSAKFDELYVHKQRERADAGGMAAAAS